MMSWHQLQVCVCPPMGTTTRRHRSDSSRLSPTLRLGVWTVCQSMSRSADHNTYVKPMLSDLAHITSDHLDRLR